MSFTPALVAGVVAGGVAGVVTNSVPAAAIITGAVAAGTWFVLAQQQQVRQLQQKLHQTDKKSKQSKKQSKQSKPSKVVEPESESEEEVPSPKVSKKQAKKDAKKQQETQAAQPAKKGGKAAPAPVTQGKKGKQPEPEPESESESEEEFVQPVLSKTAQKKAKKAAADQKKADAAKAEAASAANKKLAKQAEKASAVEKTTTKPTKATPQQAAPVTSPRLADDDGWTTTVYEKSNSQKNKAAQKAAEEAAAAAAAAASKKGGKNKVVTPEPEEDEATGQSVLEMNVPVKHFGVIIGTNGSTLQQIQTATGVKIDMPRKETNSTKITLTGAPEGVEAARHAIQSLVDRGYSSITHPGTLSDDLSVDPKYYGVIIGPKGATLKTLQTKTNTRINLPEKTSNTNRIQIIGAKENVKAAKQAIKQLVTDGFSTLTHDGYVKVELDFPKDKLRFLIGPKGHTIKSIQGNTRTKINIPDASSASQFVTIVGTPAGVTQAQKEIARLLEPVQAAEFDEDEEDDGAWGAAETAQGEDALW